MKLLLGGITAVVLGTVWAILWWGSLRVLLASIFSIFLILGGTLLAYFALDDLLHPPGGSPPSSGWQSEAQHQEHPQDDPH
jgi:hypothetical protein